MEIDSPPPFSSISSPPLDGERDVEMKEATALLSQTIEQTGASSHSTPSIPLSQRHTFWNRITTREEYEREKEKVDLFYEAFKTFKRAVSREKYLRGKREDRISLICTQTHEKYQAQSEQLEIQAKKENWASIAMKLEQMRRNLLLNYQKIRDEINELPSHRHNKMGNTTLEQALTTFPIQASPTQNSSSSSDSYQSKQTREKEKYERENPQQMEKIQELESSIKQYSPLQEALERIAFHRSYYEEKKKYWEGMGRWDQSSIANKNWIKALTEIVKAEKASHPFTRSTTP